MKFLLIYNRFIYIHYSPIIYNPYSQYIIGINRGWSGDGHQPNSRGFIYPLEGFPLKGGDDQKQWQSQKHCGPLTLYDFHPSSTAGRPDNQGTAICGDSISNHHPMMICQFVFCSEEVGL